MANFYKYAIIRLAPDDIRDERINIGVVIFTEAGIDVRTAKRLDKVRAISSALDVDVLRDLVDNFRGIYEGYAGETVNSAEDGLALLNRVGPLSLSNLGTFVADNLDVYEARIASLMRSMIDPEVAPPKIREKRSKLLTQVKSLFKQDRVLALPDEDLSSHRILSSFQIEQGLVADLVLKNGAMHVVETVDASGEEDSLKKAIGEIGTAALVLERARMKFGASGTKARLVYNASAALETIALPSLEAAAHQGAELTNWASANDRMKFVHALSSLATPIEKKRRATKFVGGNQTRLFS